MAKPTTAEVRTWHAINVYPHDLEEGIARQALAVGMLDQVDEQGYQPAPGAEPVIERFGRAPWQQTITGQNPNTGEWIGHPDDYGLRGSLKVVAKGSLLQD
jgi:uncharacterized protein (DUF924 family)